MNNTPFIAMLTAVLLTTGVDAFAQTSIEERVFVNASVGMQTLSPSFSYRDTQTIFLEEASAQLDVEGENDLVFDIGGGVRLFQNFGVGVAFSRYNPEQTGALTVTIPHPLFFNQPAVDTLDVPLKRTEKAIHLDAFYIVPFNDRIQLTVFGGPTRFSYEQQAVENFRIGADLVGSNFTIDLDNPKLRTLEGDVWGYNVGADIAFLFNARLGVGAMVRYSDGSTDVENVFQTGRTDISNTAASLDLGGLQVLGGVRLRF